MKKLFTIILLIATIVALIIDAIQASRYLDDEGYPLDPGSTEWVERDMELNPEEYQGW